MVRLRAGADGSALEQLVEMAVAVPVQTTHCHLFAGALHLPIAETVLGAVVRLQFQTAVGPQLALGAKPMRCLHQSDHARPKKWPVGTCPTGEDCKPALDYWVGFLAFAFLAPLFFIGASTVRSPRWCPLDRR
jgi:hypothetical protein